MTENEKIEPQKKHASLTGIYILLAIILLISLTSTALSITLYLSSREDEQTVENDTDIPETEQTAEEDGDTQEDNVTIAEEYVIRSTTAISDAYKSGDTSALSDKDKETMDMAAAVLDKIITDGMSNFEKEKAVYEWMTTELQNDSGLLSVIPTTQEDCDNPYGVLKYHNAVCVGYATTFRLFMQMMDIPCMVVHNTELYHSWNLVQLDGNWYHTDIYSDAGNASYAHFNMNDTMAGNTGESWDMTFYPDATSLEYNVSYQNAKEAEDIYGIPALISQAMKNNESIIALKFSNDLTEEVAENAEYMMSQMSQILSNDAYLEWNWNSVDEGYLFIVNIETYYNYEAADNVSEEEREKIDQVISEAFGDETSDDSYEWTEN